MAPSRGPKAVSAYRSASGSWIVRFANSGITGAARNGVVSFSSPDRGEGSSVVANRNSGRRRRGRGLSSSRISHRGGMLECARSIGFCSSLLSVLWGGSFFFAAVAVRDIPPLTLVLARVALAAALLGPAVHALGLPMPRGLRAWRPYRRAGPVQQPRAVQPHLLRPDAHRQRARLGAECDDAAVCAGGGACVRGRAADGRQSSAGSRWASSGWAS